MAVGTELTGNCFHAKGATARNNDCRVRVIDLLQGGRDVLHDALKRLRHVVQRAVRVHHGVFKKTIWIDIGK